MHGAHPMVVCSPPPIATLPTATTVSMYHGVLYPMEPLLDHTLGVDGSITAL